MADSGFSDGEWSVVQIRRDDSCDNSSISSVASDVDGMSGEDSATCLGSGNVSAASDCRTSETPPLLNLSVGYSGADNLDVAEMDCVGEVQQGDASKKNEDSSGEDSTSEIDDEEEDSYLDEIDDVEEVQDNDSRKSKEDEDENENGSGEDDSGEDDNEGEDWDEDCDEDEDDDGDDDDDDDDEDDHDDEEEEEDDDDDDDDEDDDDEDDNDCAASKEDSEDDLLALFPLSFSPTPFCPAVAGMCSANRSSVPGANSARISTEQPGRSSRSHSVPPSSARSSTVDTLSTASFAMDEVDGGECDSDKLDRFHFPRMSVCERFQKLKEQHEERRQSGYVLGSERHRKCCDVSASPVPLAVSGKKQVRFMPEPNLVTVHHMIVWDYAHRAARIGHWTQLHLDGVRFKKRVAELEPVISPILSLDHREKYISQTASAKCDAPFDTD